MAALLYGALVVLVTAATFATVLAARVSDHDRRSDLGGIDNFRRVDRDLWAGAQPDTQQYRVLRQAGVRLVIDLRTGADDDPNEADQAALRRLGLRYERLPVKDGHAPSPAKVERFLHLVEDTRGPTYVHCGAGVGRTGSMEAAYLAARGRDPSLLDVLAVGPLTLEQMWFVVRSDPHEPDRRNTLVRRVSETLDAPRRAISRLGALL